MKLRKPIAGALALLAAAALAACAARPEAPPPQAPAPENAASEAAAPPREEQKPEYHPVPLSLSDLGPTIGREDRSDYDFTEKALDYLDGICEDFPDRIGEDRRAAFRGWLKEELQACGYPAGQIEEQPFSGEGVHGEQVSGCNVILTVPGQSDAGQILIGAHFDGDGAGDNASGTALLLAAAAGLAGQEPPLTLRYLFFDGEEYGAVGSKYYAEHMPEEAIASTVCMINVDALLFGDFCNLYGGVYGEEYDVLRSPKETPFPLPEPEHTEGYEFAADTAEALGFRVYRTADLDGYYEAHGRGMEPEEAFFTNPWTNAHPAPANMWAPSPATIGASDHVGFAIRGIPCIYFEATNWWAEGGYPEASFTSYPETYDASLGDGGMFMNTEFDTLEQLETLFPGRAEAHYRLFSPLLSALLTMGPK